MRVRFWFKKCRIFRRWIFSPWPKCTVCTTVKPNRVVFAWPCKLTCIVFGLSFLRSLIGWKRDFRIILAKNMAKAIMYRLYCISYTFWLGQSHYFSNFAWRHLQQQNAKFTSNCVFISCSGVSLRIGPFISFFPRREGGIFVFDKFLPLPNCRQVNPSGFWHKFHSLAGQKPPQFWT